MNVIAVDVGTASVRLAVISFQGDEAQEAKVLASEKEDVAYKQDGCKFEQSSREIWQAICNCCRSCIRKCELKPESIKGIAFSATCSLVIEETQSRGVEGNQDDQNDIIMWMDHRALNQAQNITANCPKVLQQFGGVCSPEFSLAKLAWLKENNSQRFNSATGFYELPDWLVNRCLRQDSSSAPRSLCCLACKWGFNVESSQHCDIVQSLDAKIGKKIGESISLPGTVAGYLSVQAAEELGLIAQNVHSENKENAKPFLEIVVGTSLIDAHSGLLAMLSVPLKNYNNNSEHDAVEIESTFCSLAGTSSCHMLLSKEANFTPGVWGPYKDVVIQGYHLLEAGQSMTGKLIEMCIKSHEEGKRRLYGGERMYEIIASLNEKLFEKRQQSKENFMISNLHVLPTFHGNRSPLANPRLKGGVYGYSAEGSKSLLEHYMATVESLCYETKLIVETLKSKLTNILVSGGLMKNSYYMQTLADILRCQVVTMSLENIDFMVMGSGLLARHAVLLSQSNQQQPLTKENLKGINYSQLNMQFYDPNLDKFVYHEKKYSCYKEFVELSIRIDRIMHQ